MHLPVDHAVNAVEEERERERPVVAIVREAGRRLREECDEAHVV